ncbi:MAG: ROK family protein [Geminicoccaceae bacterium]|nr:ROK family protein [Geminicoccaceae bacterium]MCS7269066.1 ROK family protein [Geminicoccaceae bacterium]MCX7629105.1 ROK family protein [Geminicoccaceae bacterium]MDW8124883.1 ROK family protein [Geminicoccaceae bacterium]MDW8342402.1 ROK family protein [Geminicoccaceae bacterium]
MPVLVVDIGGRSVKLGLSGSPEIRAVPSGPDLRPRAMVERVRAVTTDWVFDRVSIGVPGPVRDGHLIAEPVNLGGGWLGFDLEHAFGLPTRVVNDAALQALGSWERGKMLFLGLGTGLGSALVVEGVVLSLELAHLPYRCGRTYEDYLGARGLERLGEERWREAVGDVVARLKAAMVADEVVLGGGNAQRLTELPPHCRRGDNARSIVGGERLWQPGWRVL